ncbi:CEP350 family protein [Megaselia abdita]
MSERMKITPYKKKTIEADNMDSPVQIIRPIRSKSREPITPRNMQIASVRYKPQSPRKPQVLQRSQTDISIKFSQEKNFEEAVVERKKSYDPEAARKFILDQKMKRKSHVDESANVKNSKDEIKKRLEDLRKSSRRILSDNVNKKKRSNSTPRSMSYVPELQIPKDNNIRSSSQTPRKPSTPRKRKEEVKENIPEQILLKKPDPRKPTFKKKQEDPKKSEIERLRKKEEELMNALYAQKPKKKVEIVENPVPSTPKSRVGLLRKPETEDEPSFTTLKQFNKKEIENKVIKDVFTPTVVHTVSKIDELNQRIEVEEHSSKIDFTLKVPEVQLKSKMSVPTQTQAETQSEKKDIPYWLKPSPVQMYPYNFIMAVRKKLEAIANPAVVKGTNVQKRGISQETPCPKVDPNKLQNVRRRITSNDTRKKLSPAADLSVRFSAVEDYTSRSSSKTTEKENMNKTERSSPKATEKEDLNKTERSPEIRDMTIISEKSPPENVPLSNNEEYSSNFSEEESQDLNKVHSLPRSEETSPSKRNQTYLKEDSDVLNKVQPLPQSEFSNFSSVSIHIPNNGNEDDTTISSSVFSSPEKKVLVPEEKVASPLNLENISSMCLKNLPKNINRGRGDFLDEHPLHSKLDAKSKSSTDSVNFNQLLEDFNRSLSQVMEVNSQLKNTLNKSHQIFSPRRTERSKIAEITTIKEYMSSRSSDETTPVKSGKIEEVYSTDFETSKNNKTNENTNESILIMKSPVGNVTTVIRRNTAVSVFPAETNKVVPEDEETDVSNNIETDVSKESEVSKDIESEVSKDIETEVSKEQKIHSEKVISEATIEESPVKENQSFNQFSRDSLDIKSDLEENSKTISKNLNTGRGDFSDEKFRINSSISSEFIAVFNNSEIDVDISCQSNYSSVGMYEQLIQAENDKSEQLVTLLKMREKAIVDRTKGQIAWLEVQKEKYKSKGLTTEISSIRKKQRGVLLKMEKERDEIRRLVQQNEVKKRSNNTTAFAITNSPAALDEPKRSDIYIRRTIASPKSPRIIRGFELESSKSLECLLRRREEELQKRRADVERLMKWHQRLDNEEEEVLHLEKLLFEYNAKPRQAVAVFDEKLERKLKEIDDGIRDLSCVTSDERVDYVRTSGGKLNKLWRRLTGQKEDRFDPKRKYKLCKQDLEKFYEEAKRIVLTVFGQNPGDMKELFEQSSFNNSGNAAVLPKLSTSGSSETSDFTAAYSPKKTEEQFQKSISEEPTSEDAKTLTPEIVDTRSEPYTNDFEDISTDWMEKSHTRTTIISDLDQSSPTGSVDQSTEKHTTEEFVEEEVVESVQEEESLLEDVPIPQQIKEKKSDKEEQNDLEKRLLDLDVSLKGLQTSFEKALSPEKATTSAIALTSVSPPKSPNLMPDIINEVELRRRQQIIIENEMKQFENTLPYIYVREIPNKPPPPYVPPAHGSPMTTIFPSEQRIKDITFRRTKELFDEIFKTEPQTEINTSITDENITNIYERIILDICKECLNDYKATFEAPQTSEQYKDPLALYNPPDRLKCVQDFVYKKVRKYLGMDSKNSQNSKKPLSIFGAKSRKIDNVDEIIIQELYEEEGKWTNFDEEEAEVKAIIIDEILNDVIKDVVKGECLEVGVEFDDTLPEEFGEVSKETSVDE